MNLVLFKYHFNDYGKAAHKFTVKNKNPVSFKTKRDLKL